MRALASLFVLAAPALAAADVRSFARTYEYSTQPEGTTSVQLWHTASRVTWDSDYAEQFEHRVELEHGVSERWDVGTSTYLVQTGRGGLVFDRVTLAARYRFADRAEWPVDLLLLFEASKLVDQSDYPLTLRVVLARDFDRLLLAANAVGTLHVGKDIPDGVDPEVAWAAGVSYQVHAKVRFGAESWGGTTSEGPQPSSDDVRASVGPVLQFAPTAKFWAVGTAGFGLTDSADAFSVRVLLGIEI